MSSRALVLLLHLTQKEKSEICKCYLSLLFMRFVTVKWWVRQRNRLNYPTTCWQTNSSYFQPALFLWPRGEIKYESIFTNGAACEGERQRLAVSWLAPFHKQQQSFCVFICKLELMARRGKCRHFPNTVNFYMGLGHVASCELEPPISEVSSQPNIPMLVACCLVSWTWWGLSQSKQN